MKRSRLSPRLNPKLEELIMRKAVQMVMDSYIDGKYTDEQLWSKWIRLYVGLTDLKSEVWENKS